MDFPTHAVRTGSAIKHVTIRNERFINISLHPNNAVELPEKAGGERIAQMGISAFSG
jgi:hypothetical protein